MNSYRGISKFWFLALLLVTFVAGCGGSGGGGTTDTLAPTVSSTNPAKDVTAVATNPAITATFSEAMTPSTLSTTTFTLKKGTSAVSGAVSYSGVTAVFTPASNLDISTEYTATITTGAKNLAGNAVASDYVWKFTTGATPDTVAPIVKVTTNVDGATNVAINTQLGATFGEGMDPRTITNVTFTLRNTTSSTAVPGTVNYSGVNAVFIPTSNLLPGTRYTATIKGGADGVKDLAGNALAADYVWGFTTAATADVIRPTVISTLPVNIATNVALNSTSNSIFSEAMDPLTVNSATVKLAGPSTAAVAGTVSYDADGKIATFTPTSPLTSGTLYTATITTGVKDLAGNTQATNKVWSFTTGSTVAKGPAPVLLGMAGDYAILAKTQVSTVPASVITGNVGVSPAATSYLTGFSLTKQGTLSATSTQVTGFLYGADMTTPTNSNLTTAVSNMEAAYTDAAGRPTPDFLNLGTGEIGGLTLVPGLYNWTTGVTISSDVTLNGGSNDVWIFQIPGNLTESLAMNVFLTGGAKAENVFWQVAGTVDIGGGAHFEGILLCQTQITMVSGASMNGRALAQSAVILNANTVTEPN